MKSTAVACLTAVLVVMAMSFMSTGSAQGRYWPNSWSHAYVHSDGRDVYVTYVEDAGCRDQKIELSLARGFNLEAGAAYLLSKATAVDLLQRRGYQMVGEGHAYCHLGDRPAIHFTRAGYY